jgi:hypothetical protein
MKPTTHKFVVVLNKKVPVGNLMNAIGHMTVGLACKHPDQEGFRLQDYIDADGGVHPNISDNPYIVLQADNSNKIRTLRNVLIEQDIPFTDFTSTMTVGTYAEQQERTRQTPEAELEYWGICFFGPADAMNVLTKKFSLWRS